MILLAGLGIGVVYGVFGAGGSAFATPVLALLGVPPVLAVASPLPATIPAALSGSFSYARQGMVDGALARRAVVIGAPAAVLGAVLSQVVGGDGLLVLSAAMLLVIGASMVRRAGITGAAPGAVAAPSNHLLTAVIVTIGLATGLLANSGGFLLTPAFVLIFGLGMHRAAGTSLLVAAAMSVPSLATHWYLGHIDWMVAGSFAVGLIPGSILGARVGGRIDPARVQRGFGVVLVAFAVWFAVRLVAA